MIHVQLNKLKTDRSLYVGLAWCPDSMLGRVKSEVDYMKNDLNFTGPQMWKRETKLMPPTFLKTNAFTAPFQQVVNTYAVPSYKEINPAVFTISTFPFLFGMMFGDVGHGTLLALFGVSLIFSRDRKSVLFPLRYMIFLLGFFSIFCGFIYNDMLSIPVLYGNSCYV